MNNDFYLYYHDGLSATLRLDYTTSGSAAFNLDLILYYGSYVYQEDDYYYAGRTSNFVARSSRNATGAETVNLAGLPAGIYMLNVKINAYNKLQYELNGNASYTRHQKRESTAMRNRTTLTVLLFGLILGITGAAYVKNKKSARIVAPLRLKEREFPGFQHRLVNT